MRQRVILLATASLVYGSPSVFSVHDDLLAFPQYEVIFSDTYVSDIEAESRLAYSSSSSVARAKPTPSTAQESTRLRETPVGLSTQSHHGSDPLHESTRPDPSETPDHYESMILNSTPYLCAIPQVSSNPKNETSAASSKAEEEKELARATDRGWELLKDMEGHCMYFISGWWSYSFCYNTDVQQFHQLPPGRGGVPMFPPVPDPTTPTYVLGKFDNRDKQNPRLDGQQGEAQGSEGTTSGGLQVAEMQAKGDMRYLVQKLTGGTPCDLTGKARKVEIQFHCHPQSADRIGWIKEVTTCSYLMVIYTPRLCNDVAFLPPRENKAHAITCREIVPSDSISDWEARRSADASLKLVNSGSAESESRPTVGGIVVGGQKQVGSEGRRIEPPKPASQAAGNEGGKVDVVAKSDPNEDGGQVQKLSDQDLKKLDLNPKTVEMLRRQLEDLAEGKPWKLVVVDVEEGVRELRGVVEGGDEEGEDEGKGQETGQESGGGDGEEYNEDDPEGEGSEEMYKDEL